MKSFESFLQDIRTGQNIDLYATFAIAVVVAFLSILGWASQSLIASLTTAILALLAYGMLANRRQMEKINERLTETSERVLLSVWPEEDLRSSIETSKDLLILGHTLTITMKKYFSLFENKLKKGDTIRIVIVNPDSVASEIIAQRSYCAYDAKRAKSEIGWTLGSLSDLAKKAPPGKLELRVSNYPIPIACYSIDSHTTHGVIYVGFYPFKMPGRDRPKFVFSPQDRDWYEFFIQQAEVIWENGVNWDALERQKG